MEYNALDMPNEASINNFGKNVNHLIEHSKIMISISGGSDSDLMLDFLLKSYNNDYVKIERDLRFVFFDTGIEFKATKEHLDYLEKKYNIKIERKRASVPVPLGCKTYGVPFISKFISQMIERLQEKNFDFANDGDKDFDFLCEKYPKTKGALTWWCNKYRVREHDKPSQFNISTTKYLKEFMIANPPTFKISARCCEGAKKNPSKDYVKSEDVDLICLGLRKAEGGVRSTAIKSCFSEKSYKGIDVYRPIWWFSDKEKEQYCDYFKVEHSKCYTEYGFKRTGCCSCPYNSKFEQELLITKAVDINLFNAVNNIFGASYEYTRAYRKFKEEMVAKEKAQKSIIDGQISLFEKESKNES